MRPKNQIERLRFVRDVITQWRDRINFYRHIDTNTAGIYPLTYGFIGVLDYIKTGDTEKISCAQLRIIIENQIGEK